MSEMLDKTIEQVKQLPKGRQDAIAAFIYVVFYRSSALAGRFV